MSKYNYELDLKSRNALSIIAEKIKKGSCILEFGPAHGRLTKHLKEDKSCIVDIVEIDYDAGKEASCYANRALLGSEKGNIEKYFWLEEFKDRQYDYIVFADVLEHLYSPEQVLEKCKNVLRKDGMILISIPNIAHNSVLINLYYDTFNYTETGILDNTHLRFWGLHNIKSLCEKVGYSLVEIESINILAENTEQAEFFNQRYRELNDVLNQRKFGDAYQFILQLKTQKSYSIEHNELHRLMHIPMNIYVNTGKGYNENEKISDTIISGCKHKRRYSLEQFSDIESLRIDPAEGIFCKVGSISVASNVELEQIIPINSFYKNEKNSDVFFTLDPGYELKGNLEGISFLEIEMTVDKISLLDLVNEAQKLIYRLEGKNHIDKEQLKCEQEENKKYKEQLKCEQEENKKCKEQLKCEQEENKKCKEQLDIYKLHYEEAIRQREDLKRRLLHVQAQYSTVINATSWKLTKPLRIIMDTIKSVAKANSVIYLCWKGIKCIRQNGYGYTFDVIKHKLTFSREVQKPKGKPLYSKEELEIQRQTKFDENIKFSMLVPLYNTPEKFLCEMIESVQSQTYAEWELCLADGSNTKQKCVEAIVKDYMAKDTRIRYRKLKENKGIAGNTNECIYMATGQYMVLLDHDDILHPAALFECMRAITEQNADFIYTDENTFAKAIDDAYCPHFKPDYSPDTLRSYNYICHLSAFSSELLREVGEYRSEFDGSQDYDMVLRLTEKAKNIVHISKILYYWRAHQASVASDISAKPYTIIAAKKALQEHLDRVGLEGIVKDSKILSTYKMDYKIIERSLVSIIIPNKDHCDDLKKCIDSIFRLSTYTNFEIIVIENNSKEPTTFNYYEDIKQYKNIQIINWENDFNYSAINNYGAKFAKGDYLLLLNNDVEIITPNWMEEMLMFAQRKDVGAVGAMLYYPDDTVQHAGVILGIGGIAGHSHKYSKKNSYGYMSRMTIAQNLSGVTGACLMVSQLVFKQVGGLDESLGVAFNDVDLCMKIREAGYLIVWTPYSELYHYESKSRGIEDTAEKKARFSKEVHRFYEKWDEELKKGDPYYNSNLTLEKEDFSII